MVRGYALCDTRIEAWLFKAGKQADATRRRGVSPSARKLRTSRRAYHTLIFRQRFSPFPSASGVSFTCLPSRCAEERAGRFQSPRGRSSTAPRRKKTGWDLACPTSLARCYTQRCEEKELENLRAWNTHLEEEYQIASTRLKKEMPIQFARKK